MWWWMLTILFFLIGVGLSALVYFSLRRINQYENLLVDIEQIINFASEKMKQVDSNGHYESDDETGFFFDELKKLQLALDGVFVNEVVKEKIDVKTNK